MSYFHVSVIKIDGHQLVKKIKFDNKEDAEHYAKNESSSDNTHIYEIQKNKEGNFFKIKSYVKGQEI